MLHQRVVREGVAGNHCAAGACHGIQRLFLGENMAPAGRGCAKLESNRSNEDKEWINMGKYATRWIDVEKW